MIKTCAYIETVYFQSMFDMYCCLLYECFCLALTRRGVISVIIAVLQYSSKVFDVIFSEGLVYEFMYIGLNVLICFIHRKYIRYKLLGQGSYGEVWSCIRMEDDCDGFAVKFVEKRDAWVVSDVLREINILSRLRDCPHIVHYIECFDEESRYVFLSFTCTCI